MQYLFAIACILFLALYISILKTEPEPFGGLTDTFMTTINKHKRTTRTTVQGFNNRMSAFVNRTKRQLKI